MNEDKLTTICIQLPERIDSDNANQKDQEIRSQLEGHECSSVILDASDLKYISSAGLRVLLRLKKNYDDFVIKNVNSEVYEIFEMTGFTEIMTVEKAYRIVSVEGCEVIGEGFNGKVYRIDKDNVVKTYKNSDALAEIQHEREVAKLALILGVPTAISYDVVKVGDSYGSVFELLNAKSFSKILAEEPERMDFCVTQYIKMLKHIHSIVVPEGKLPSIKQKKLRSAERMKHILPAQLGNKLISMMEAIPESNHMIHGDYHTKNIVLAADEVLLIDMDTLSVGDPIFELSQMYNSYVGYSEYDLDIVKDFQGYDASVARSFWHKSLAAYLDTDDESIIKALEDRVRIVSYANLIDWSMRHSDANSETDEKTFELWKSRLIELLTHTNSLLIDANSLEASKQDAEDSYTPAELTIEASADNLHKVMNFVNNRIQTYDYSAKSQMQMDLAVEEVFINIANYAYAPGHGNATVKVEVSNNPLIVTITFIDRGVPYDPLNNATPDINLPAEDREIGGLGIFLTKKVMDDVSYEYKDGQNILMLKKQL
ncbi:MAG: ATP-binding protein [Lachnospiraceae bacterium]|nr:ATP-binding protein [Lachnospiraceae bacterium]